MEGSSMKLGEWAAAGNKVAWESNGDIQPEESVVAVIVSRHKPLQLITHRKLYEVSLHKGSGAAVVVV